MAIHPNISGRTHVLFMHKKHINQHEEAEWVTKTEMADDFKSYNKPAEGQ